MKQTASAAGVLSARYVQASLRGELKLFEKAVAKNKQEFSEWFDSTAGRMEIRQAREGATRPGRQSLLLNDQRRFLRRAEFGGKRRDRRKAGCQHSALLQNRLPN